MKVSKFYCILLFVIATATSNFIPPGDIIIIEQGVVYGDKREITFTSQIEEDLEICILHPDGKKEPLLRNKRKEKRLLKKGEKYKLIYCGSKKEIKSFVT